MLEVTSPILGKFGDYLMNDILQLYKGILLTHVQSRMKQENRETEREGNGLGIFRSIR